MEASEFFLFIQEMIRCRPVSGSEQRVLACVEERFERLGWRPERIHMDDGRYNLFATFGEPRVVFTTHLDVVPAPEALFEPRVEGETLYGRGACDALGIAAAMIETARRLLAAGCSDFGILFVIEEEITGNGARKAAGVLKGRGIRYLVNGEPTNNSMIRAHKGGLGGTISFAGRSCHSGYPELGEDANLKLLRCAQTLTQLSYGDDPEMGVATLNLGTLQGGVADNVVSPQARLGFLVRTVKPNAEARSALQKAVEPYGRLEFTYDSEPARMFTLPSCPTRVASFCTDIPNFSELGTECALYGPGAIERAHTDGEFVTRTELGEAVRGYGKIYSFLTPGSRYNPGEIH